MSSDLLNLLYADLRARIKVVWPDVADSLHGIYEGAHAAKIAWENFTGVPYAVLIVEEFPAAEFGMDNSVFAPRVDIYRVEETHGILNDLRTNLNLLRADLLTADMTNSQVTDVVDISYAAHLPPNEVFVSKRMAHHAGKVTAEMLIGEIIGT